MEIKFLVDEDIANYKDTSMFIGFPHCTFKCDKQCGKPICQNSKLALDPCIEVNIDEIVRRYVSNPLTHAVVIGGLEPFDDWSDLRELLFALRRSTNDVIVIYTGYYEEEIQEYLETIKSCQNIIIKYGRFIPDNEGRYDYVLGVHLSSDNQYAIHYIGTGIKDGRIQDSSKL